jgi:hypothetical protein
VYIAAALGIDNLVDYQPNHAQESDVTAGLGPHNLGDDQPSYAQSSEVTSTKPNDVSQGYQDDQSCAVRPKDLGEGSPDVDGQSSAEPVRLSWNPFFDTLSLT